MLFQLAPRSSLLARVLVLLLAAVSVAPALLHGPFADDALCETRAGSTDLALTTGASHQAPEHCAVCHWLRGLRSFGPALAAAVRPADVAGAPAIPAAAAAFEQPVSPLPGRAPPSPLLS